MKKKFKDTKVGKLLTKIAPDIITTVGNVFPPANILKGLIKDEPSLDESQRMQLNQMMNEYEIEVFKLEVEDRNSARINGDKHLQQVLAYFSLIGFALFTIASMTMAYQILANGLKINNI